VSDPHGYLCLVLHAHLPYVRHPEYPDFLEEDWFYEAVTETYVPILDILERLAGEKIPFRITMSLTPPLCNMLSDDLLISRYRAKLEKLLELAEKEVVPDQKPCRRRFKKPPPCIWASFDGSKKFWTGAAAGSSAGLKPCKTTASSKSSRAARPTGICRS
jgi:hypothetical protein